MSKSRNDNNLPKFEFDNSFKETFNVLIDIFSKSVDKLNKVSSGSTIKSEYGVCSCCYKLRYITPKDVSTYISNIIKALSNGLFNNHLADIEMFTVASVKRFIEDNGCVPFESSNTLDGGDSYVNPKNQTLNDLAFMCENDTCEVAVYSRGEMLKRIELMSSDVKRINDMHFTANMKKIVSSLSDIIDKSEARCYMSNGMMQVIFTKFVEEFILFACTLNTITVLQLISYGNPSVEYTTKPNDDNSNGGVVTECCMLKTNDFMIRNRIPFNCNMRDIVLQDVTPHFKDTHDALHFIMRDRRSPISILVDKFATKQANCVSDCDIVRGLFAGECHRRGGSMEWHTKDGNTIDDCPRCANGFRNKPKWLDTIAFGNNYLDGNYRRDAVGNNNSHPITNSLDSLYKIFGGCDLKTNEDIANNVVRVACLMRETIQNYKEDMPENYDITKEILVVLGEILTRNMLKLYYNNTRVFCYSDNMPDAAVPGFLCMESFVMEADGQPTNGTTTTNTTTGQQASSTAIQNNANANKTTVTFSNKENMQVKKNMNVKASTILNKFIQWIRTQMAKFSENFNKNHKKEIEWIKNNMKLNEEIGAAISKKTFTPNVTNLPKFNIPADKLIKSSNLAELVSVWVDLEKTKEFNIQEMSVKSSGLDETLQKKLSAIKDPTEQSNAFTNYILFSDFKQPQPFTGPLTAEQWKELYTDLLETPELIAKISKAHSDDLDKAATFLQRKIQSLEQLTGDDAQKNAPALERCNQVNKIIQDSAKLYKSKTLNAINGSFYSKNYVVYREIVAGYKQQNNANTGTSSTNTTESLETPDSTGNTTTENENQNNNK